MEGQATARVLLRCARPSRVTLVDEDPDVVDPGVDGAAFASTADAPAALRAAEVVVASPGISRYRPDYLELAATGVELTGPTAIWLSDDADAEIVGVTGTKGKGTTTTLIGALLDAVGRPNLVVGNMGRPVIDLLADRPEPGTVRVAEVAALQSVDVTASPRVGVFTTLFPEHLDLFGDMTRYAAAKANLFAHRDDGVVLVHRDEPSVVDALEGVATPTIVGGPTDLHAEGHLVRLGSTVIADLTGAALRGRHNMNDLVLALAAVRELGIDLTADADRLEAAARGYQLLPHRLDTVSHRGGVRWIDDTLSTIPQSTVAALDTVGGAVTLLVGGQDRGVDPGPLIDRLAAAPDVRVVTMPDTGPAVAAGLRARGAGNRLHDAGDIDDAVAIARRCTPKGGSVLLSPAAPSFHRFRDYQELSACYLAAIEGGSVTG